MNAAAHCRQRSLVSNAAILLRLRHQGMQAYLQRDPAFGVRLANALASVVVEWENVTSALCWGSPAFFSSAGSGERVRLAPSAGGGTGSRSSELVLLSSGRSKGSSSLRCSCWRKDPMSFAVCERRRQICFDESQKCEGLRPSLSFSTQIILPAVLAHRVDEGDDVWEVERAKMVGAHLVKCNWRQPQAKLSYARAGSNTRSHLVEGARCGGGTQLANEGGRLAKLSRQAGGQAIKHLAHLCRLCTVGKEGGPTVVVT
jgi:hypothetical protein